MRAWPKGEVAAFCALASVEARKRILRHPSLRLGQAFFDMLPPSLRAQLTGTTADPYERDDWKSIAAAVDYLMDRAPEDVPC